MSCATAATGIVAAALATGAGAADASALVIPQVRPGTQRSITLQDMMALRVIDTLSVAPDGRHFAIFVRQANPQANEYRAAWFAGETQDGKLTFVGDGGEAQLLVRPSGHVVGEIAGKQSRWSPDCRRIAYTLLRDGEEQLWVSRADGTEQKQLTHNAADVRDFAWNAQSTAIYFNVGTPRAERHAQDVERSLQGYRYDEDIWTFTDLLAPQLSKPPETDLTAWIFSLATDEERIANDSERDAFTKAQTLEDGGVEPVAGFAEDAVVPPVKRAHGGAVWLVRSSPVSQRLKVVASLSAKTLETTTCAAQPCFGAIKRVWWSADEKDVYLWRGEGVNDRSHGIYRWSPQTGAVSAVLRARDDDLESCSPAAHDVLVCVRETKTKPSHLIAIELKSGKVRMLADVNPEFRNICLGAVERFEWNTPAFKWNEPGGKLEGLYAKRAYGYILYPPDFDRRKEYPVFIDPYTANGFNGSVGVEHALHVYAANGIVVLNMAFPQPSDAAARLGASAMKQTYSAELDFPHLSMFMESTVRGLDAAAVRGFIDEHRVGIGGVSHGSFVPLYMMQKHDRIAAASISSPSWGALQYYWTTRKYQEALAAAYGKIGYEDWMPKPEGAGADFWRSIDIADHVDEVEAPLLFQLAAQETYGSVRLLRYLADAGKPYDAYVFTDETHLKWQPAHLRAIRERNLDWFRYWLQDVTDPAPAKAEQYARWKALRELQCRNPRSLRNYCGS